MVRHTQREKITKRGLASLVHSFDDKRKKTSRPLAGSLVPWLPSRQGYRTTSLQPNPNTTPRISPALYN